MNFPHAANILRMLSERSREDSGGGIWLTGLSAGLLDVHLSVSRAGFAVHSPGLEFGALQTIYRRSVGGRGAEFNRAVFLGPSSGLCHSISPIRFSGA